jgi:hypothetical protein
MDLTNEGGGTIEGEVAVPEPWSVEGLKIFKIAAGKTATFRLVFTPTRPGARTGEAVISGTEKKIVLLRASAEERLAVTPAQLKLTAQRGSQTRTGMLKIGNHSPEAATVLVETGARLMTDRTVKVPAHGTSAVPVFADATTAAAFDDAVTLSSGEWKATVPVHAVAVGVILKFTAEEVEIAGGSSGSAIAILENHGGEPATVRLDVGHPFEVASRVVTAPARGRVEIPVLLRASDAGTFRSTLKAVGEGGAAVIPVIADIQGSQPEKKTARPSASPDEGAADSASSDSSAQENETPLIPQDVRAVPNALGKFGRGTGKDSATLEWPAELGPVENLRIEERVLSFSAGDELQVGWMPLPSVTITPAGDTVTAVLRGLRPGTLYTVRVVTAADKESPVLFTADFQTAYKKPFYTGSLLTPLLVVALLILAGAIWRSRRAQQPGKR